MKSFLTVLSLAFSLTLTVASQTAIAANLDAEPVDLVQEVSDEIFSELDAKRDFYEETRPALEDLVRNKFIPMIDSIYAARLILGREGRKLEKSQIKDFADALSDLLVRRYAEGILEFRSRDQLTVLPLTGNNTEKATRVRTKVLLTNGQEAPVDYVFRKSPVGWRVFDVVIEGISYVTTYRNQFGEEIRRDGFDSVLQRIRSGEVDTDFSDKKASP